MEVGKFTLNRILEERVPAAFTACFAPRCSNFGMPGPQSGDDRCDESTQHEALMQMEINVKKHISTVVQENVSLMTEGDEALLSELGVEDEQSTSFSDFTNLNTIGEETLQDVENRRNENTANGMNSVSPRLPKLPDAYKQSVKSKFDYYRQHQLFNASALRPIDENSEIDGQMSDSVNTTAKEKTAADLQDSKVSVSLSFCDSTPTVVDNSLSPLDLTTSTDIENSNLSTPSSARRTDLAKQILQRRQSRPMTPSRVTIDP